MKKIIAALCLASLSSITSAGPLDRYYIHKLEKSRSLRTNVATVAVNYYSQLIDHNNPDLGTFMQRYYIDETYSTSDDSPVFFYICGEATCYRSSLSGEIRTMAQKYHAKLIALEHRYYGKSLPTKTFSKGDLKYLSTDFALKDLARFQKDISKRKNWTGKWISFGGSYPGSLSAYYRLKYPDLVAGSLASSAPVRAKENFEEYDAHVTKVAGPECASKMRVATNEIQASLADPKKATAIKKAFGVERLKDDNDFLFLVADIGAAAVQYGYKPTFCRMLEESSNPVDGYAKFAKYFYSAWGIQDPISLSTQGAESENPADYEDGLGMRQWYYQSCTEYGYWQNANSDPSKSTRSALVNEAYFQNVCKRLFDIKSKANTNYINNNFYKLLLSSSTSNIFFTNGSTDPWSLLSMSTRNGNDGNKNLNYYVIEGAAHCDDLRTPRGSDSVALRKARSKLTELITNWLTV